jgi:hypothetical protein
VKVPNWEEPEEVIEEKPTVVVETSYKRKLFLSDKSLGFKIRFLQLWMKLWIRFRHHCDEYYKV